MEVSLLRFIPLIFQKNNKYSVESALKYFLIQAVASSIIIFSISLDSYKAIFFILLSLLLKTGSAPFHQWVPRVIQGISWVVSGLFLTVQKINPLVLISFLSSFSFWGSLICVFVVSSALVGSVGGLVQTSLRKILAFSSISHLSWILSAILLANWRWLAYFFVYSLILFSVIYLFYESSLVRLNQIFVKINPNFNFLASITMLSLGGLPPFTGFIPKWLVLQYLVQSNFLLLCFVLLLGTFVSLFFYCRVFVLNLIYFTFKHNFAFGSKFYIFLILVVNLIGLLLFPWLFI